MCSWEVCCFKSSQRKLHGNTLQLLYYASEAMRRDSALKGKEKYPVPELCRGLHPVLTLLLAAVIMSSTNQFQEISTPSIMSHVVTSFSITSRASCWHLRSSYTTNWYKKKCQTVFLAIWVCQKESKCLHLVPFTCWSHLCSQNQSNALWVSPGVYIKDIRSMWEGFWNRRC